MKIVYCFLFVLFNISAKAQALSEKLQSGFEKFESDSQLRTATASLYVINAKTGELVYEKNGHVGMATASTLKVITAATAYDLLGKDFRYKTIFSLVKMGENKAVLRISPSGDPSFGSWRWVNNNRYNTIKRIVSAVISGKTKIIGIQTKNIYDEESIPGGWIWEDIGNYYGAGAQGLNWNENQFDVILSSGNAAGDPVKIVSTQPLLYTYSLQSNLLSAAKGTGDNAYIYLPAGRKNAVIRGTIPAQEKHFIISGSMPSAADEFSGKLADTLSRLKLYKADETIVKLLDKTDKFPSGTIGIEVSPALDSLVYWFLKKSINLYGEAFTKTLGYNFNGGGSTEKGVDTIISFWKARGIDPAELRIVDGSGLSPLNRITTHAQVTVLQYAQKQSWFAGYYNAFPEYNGMKMKSGTINGVKGFCGYQKSSDGNEYIFSFLVNNYNGSTNKVIEKMYKLLDYLK
jgi:serine-type D-Ala-D-Ala carboxypeptidase/endopeptidase (penicillin-binding protein 4)